MVGGALLVNAEWPRLRMRPLYVAAYVLEGD
jgi:hypothetical protein